MDNLNPENNLNQVIPPVQPLSKTASKGSRKWLVIGVGIITLVVLLVGSFILGGKMMNKPSSVPKTSTEAVQNKLTPTPIITDTTAGWRTYQDPPNGLYSIKFPNDWTSLEKVNEISIYPSGYPFKAPGEPNSTNPYIKFVVLPGVMGRGVSPIKKETITIAGKQATKFYETTTQGVIETIAAPNGQGISISFQLPQEISKQTSIDSIFDQILATIKFTNQTVSQSADTKTWNISSVSKIQSLGLSGYTIKYPTTWTLKDESPVESQSSRVILTKSGYSITIYQAAMGGARCIYEGDLPNGPYSDKRGLARVDVQTGFGSLRRTEATSQTGKAYSFCQLDKDSGSYGSITSIGTISYITPTNPDQAILTEMDNIIKSVNAN
jgi:hypothetical protein